MISPQRLALQDILKMALSIFHCFSPCFLHASLHIRKLYLIFFLWWRYHRWVVLRGIDAILSSWNSANYQFDHWMSSVFYGAFTEWVPHQGTVWIKGSNLFIALMAYWHTSQLNGVKRVTKFIFIRQYF